MNVREIAKFVGGEFIGNGDVEIDSVADISRAVAGQLAFFEKNVPLPSTQAGCIIIRDPGLTADREEASPVSFIILTNPKLAFARIAAVLHPAAKRSAELHPSAVVADSARIGSGVFIGAFTMVGDNSTVGEGTQLRAGAKIGDRVTIGRNCVLHPNTTVYDGCTIGDNVILHAGVVIGADGFGYVKDENGEHIKFPQIGTVVIENDVEIGANSCIDRGALGETRIGEGTKIDNLVQVGHNVNIGKRCVIAGMAGISGSVTIEDDCVIAGQAGLSDHVRLMSGAVIGAQAAVLPGKIVRPGVWFGTPIQPLDEYKRQHAMVKGLARMKEELTDLKKKLDKVHGNES